MRISRLAFALVISMLLSASLAAQQAARPYKDDPKIPDTPACKRALEIVDLVNKGDTAAVRAYILQNCTQKFRDMAPMEEHLQFVADVRARSEGRPGYERNREQHRDYEHEYEPADSHRDPPRVMDCRIIPRGLRHLPKIHGAS